MKAVITLVVAIMAAALLAPVAPEAAAAASLQVTPTAAPAGGTLYVYGVGFDNGESVSFWATAPGGQVVVPDPSTAVASGIGEVWLIFETGSGYSTGDWQLTAQGVISGRQAITSFQIGPPGPQTRADLFTSPAAGPSGTTFRIYARGLAVEEPVSYWVTAPTGQVFAEVSQERTDASGEVWFNYPSPGHLWPGRWAITVHGLWSGQQVIGFFDVTAVGRSATLAVDPVQGVAGGRFTFTGSGYDPGERLNAWVTAPDGSARAVDYQYADAGGAVRFVYTAPGDLPTGRWAMTVYGTRGGANGVAYFEIAR